VKALMSQEKSDIIKKKFSNGDIKMKRYGMLALALSLILTASACSGGSSSESGTDDTSAPSGSSQGSTSGGAQGGSSDSTQVPVITADPVNVVDSENAFSKKDLEAPDTKGAVAIKLNGDTAECTNSGVKISGGTVTITSAGTYVISGILNNGMIIVDAGSSDKVTLVLDGADITSSESAALYVRQADKVFVSLAKDSENSLKNGGTFKALDENDIDAAVFSKDDITFNGEGSLTVASPAGHGILSKDELTVAGGSYSITAASHGLRANDAINVTDVDMTISAGKDGMHSDNSDDAALGTLYIKNGKFDITSDGDALSASASLQLDNGEYKLTCGSEQTTSGSGSTKAIKAGGDIAVNNGSFSINCADDAVHCDGAITVCGGSLEISTGDDAFHSGGLLTVNGGAINVTDSLEGFEGQSIEINDGYITLRANDDGMNAAGGNDESGFGGWGGDRFGASSDSYININGGTLRINADGDGIDSNGSINVTGGATYVSGPTNGGNSALDYGAGANITGGIFVAAGSSQMAAGFTSAEGQGAVLQNINAQTAEGVVVLKKASGEVVFSWQPEKTYSSIVLSCPELKQGESYTLTCGGNSFDITMTELLYGQGMGGHMGGDMGNPMGGGHMGGRGDKMPPDGDMMPPSSDMTPPNGDMTPPTI